MKELSIIIPHYNSPQLLCNLLDSIPNIPDIEVLVVDDNSDHDAEYYMECKEKYGNRNISFYRNDSNKKGAGSARNVGLEHATGKWLLFADADDFFLQGFWNTIVQYVNDESDIIFFTSTSIILGTDHIADRHINYKRLVENYCSGKKHEDELKLRYKYYSPCTKMIKRELVENNNIRFDETLYSNDVMFSVKAGYFAKKIKAVEKDIYCITKSQKSLTADTSMRALKIRSRVFCNYYFFMHKVLSKDDMKILGYGWKEYLYFCKCKLKILLNID